MIIPEKWDDNFEALARPPSHIQIPGLSSHTLNCDMYPVLALSHSCIDPNSFEKSVASFANSDSSTRLQHMLLKMLACVLSLITPMKGPEQTSLTAGKTRIHWIYLYQQIELNLLIHGSIFHQIIGLPGAMAPTIRSKVWRAPTWGVWLDDKGGWEKEDKIYLLARTC